MTTFTNMVNRFIKPFKLITNNKDLFMQSLIREVSQKYKGAYLGVLWNFIMPLVMMVVYSFVFGVVFKAKWDFQVSNSNSEFALILFVGITIFTLFSEAINAAPLLVISNANYVKKVIYPLHLLSVTNVCASFVQTLFNVLIILIAKAIILGSFDFMFLLFPLVILPHVLIILGISWIFASIGVYIRDTKQGAAIVSLVFGYATPVFFPLSALPENVQWVMLYNPMTIIVENARRVLIYGLFPEWDRLIVVLLVSYIVFLLGYYTFAYLSRGFSDVM